MKSSVDIFRPGRSFPAVSVTGVECELSCRHCAGHYLRGMRPACEPETLLGIAHRLDDEGANGILISGGCDASGRVPLERFSDVISEIKDSTALALNVHVGLASREELARLVAAGVDAFSVDVYGSDSAVRATLGLMAGAEDFYSVVRDLKDMGAEVAPHLCVGIEGGRVVGEIKAISSLRILEPDTLVFIIFTPTKGTAYEACAPPSENEVVKVVEYAREHLPETRLVLGCMRPRRGREYELGVVAAGIDGIVMPSNMTLHGMHKAHVAVKEKRTCCALG